MKTHAVVLDHLLQPGHTRSPSLHLYRHRRPLVQLLQRFLCLQPLSRGQQGEPGCSLHCNRIVLQYQQEVLEYNKKDEQVTRWKVIRLLGSNRQRKLTSQGADFQSCPPLHLLKIFLQVLSNMSLFLTKQLMLHIWYF